jgi:hypothetical protein
VPAGPGKKGGRPRELRGTIGCIKGQVGNKFHLESAADFYYFSLLIAES